ncbi:RNA polymerase sigma factor, partial [Clostridioides difficile]
MNEKADLAHEDYLKGLKYKEIAEKYNVSLSTVKSWATRYWKQKGCN